MRKLLILLLIILIALETFDTFDHPTRNFRTFEDYEALSPLEKYSKAARTNTNGIKNFYFQYENTIRSWYTDPYDDYNRPFVSDSVAKENWYILGKYLPYFIVFMIIILLKYELQKGKGIRKE
jgi:hypothetical protein